MITKLESIRCRNSHDPVVMVDDSATDLDIARRVFELSNLKNPFLPFLYGSEFLDYMTQVKKHEKPLPSLVLMDLNMPGLNGFEVIERIRQDDEFKDMPIIVVLTNSDNPRDTERAIEVGANGYQTKYFDIDDYVAFFNRFEAVDRG